MNKLDYSAAGVDIEKGDSASRAAYKNAKNTFSSRKGMIGEPLQLDGGFSGALDFGDFLLIQNDDGTGTKTEIAERINDYSTIGEDLLAMVADDAICVGAEVVSLTNTFDVPTVDPQVLDQMTESLANACAEQRIVIPGGEIAEVPDAAKKIIWNATSVGVVKKERFITGKNIKEDDVIIGLKGRVLRSNGMSLARKICEKHFGENWHNEPWKNGKTWGQVLLTPSKIFHRLVLDNVIGDFDAPRPFNISGICHITGGGIPGNVPRILPKSLGAKFDNLHEPHNAIKKLKELENIDEKECYKTWHCGTAMMIFCSQNDAEKICEILNNKDNEVEAKIIGNVTNSGKIELISKFSGKLLSYDS